MSDPKHELAAIGADIHVTYRRLVTLHLNPILELETIMSALDDLKTLGPRIDAVTASLDTDIAAKVAAATDPLNAEIANLTGAAMAQESDTQAVAIDLMDKVSALETAAGVSAPAPAEQPAEGQ